MDINAQGLKNSLSLILTYAELAQRNDTKERTQESLNLLKNSVMNLTSVINDLSQLSKLGKEKLDFRLVNLSTVLSSVVEEYKSDLKKVQGEVQIHPLPQVQGVESLIHQLFSNLLSNSIKYRSPERDLRIDVSAIEQDGKIILSFKDNGIGIPNEEVEEIFQIHVRGETKDVQQKEGKGIGLGFCKKISYLHHGDIWVDTTNDRGTCFKISFLA